MAAFPCEPWIDTLSCAQTGEGGDTPENIAHAIAVAMWVVWHLSPVKYGLSCPRVIRPCPQRGCSCPGPRCRGCDLTGALDLGGDLHDVVEVKVDGVVFTDWRLVATRYLARTDGLAWPPQDLFLEPTEVGTSAITIRTGEPPPAAGQRAVDVLGCEVLAAIRPVDGRRCRLPKRTRTVARQGVTVEVIDPQEFLQQGRTGLYEVDSFIRAAAADDSAVVWSPDFRPGARRG